MALQVSRMEISVKLEAEKDINGEEGGVWVQNSAFNHTAISL